MQSRSIVVEGIRSVAAPPKFVESDLVGSVVRNRRLELRYFVDRIGRAYRLCNIITVIVAHWRTSLFRPLRGDFSSV